MLNQYPAWKYLLVLVIVTAGFIYALPNIYGEDPAIQISAPRGAKLDASALTRVEGILKTASLPYMSAVVEDGGIKVRFKDNNTQLKAKDLVQRELGSTFTVALNLLPATPMWLRAIDAKPMYLGLDLRGGVHFLLQVDMEAAAKKAEERFVEDIRALLRGKNIRYLTVTRPDSGGVDIRFRDTGERDKARDLIRREIADLVLAEQDRGSEFVLIGKLTEAALREKRKFALDQNLTSLNNRVNELGVAEPIIQQQGADRIVVQLPGVQDTARAKEILGRTATLEIMLVDEQQNAADTQAGRAPPGSKIYLDRRKQPIALKKQVIYSGDNIVDAAAGFDNQQGGPVVHISLDARGATINQRITGENVGKRMAVVYIELKSEPKLDNNGSPVLDEEGRVVQIKSRIEEVITAPVIREQLGKRFQISGLESVEEARDLALLLRAGALAAPIYIIEERTIGPSLGQENIDQGVQSVLIGFVAVTIFMIVYYSVFGIIANLALLLNLFLLVAILSIFQATLTLPGIAGILLTLGMAVDANVLINERIREELRNGNSPQASIHSGYEKALGTIADSNITTLIAALMLFNIGTGPIKGFAITLSIGILTTLFTAVMGARAITNIIFGGRKITKVPV